MEGIYPIERAGNTIGQAEVTRQGLYYHFTCRCRLSGEVICRLAAVCGDKVENLGVPVPENGEFVLRKKIPASHLGEGKLHIRVLPKHSELTGRFVPLSPEEPFRYLSRLQNAYLERRNGQVGIVIQE
jgi:hypothetical protein